MLDTKNEIAVRQTNRIGYAVTTVLESRAETPSAHVVRVAKPYGFDFNTSQLLLALGVLPEHILQEQFRGYARHMEVAA